MDFFTLSLCSGPDAIFAVPVQWDDPYKWMQNLNSETKHNIIKENKFDDDE